MSSMPATRQLIAQAGHALGDRVAIAALLLHDPASQVLISRCPADARDRSGLIHAFYRDCGIPEGQLHFFDTPDLGDQAALDAAASDLAVASADAPPLTPAGAQVGMDFLLAQWGKKAVPGSRTLPQQIRLRWGFNPDAAALREELASLSQRLLERGLSPQMLAGKKVAVIWSPCPNDNAESGDNQKRDMDRGQGHGGAHIPGAGVSIPGETWARVMQDVAAAALGSDIDLFILAGDRASGASAVPVDSAIPLVDLTGLWSAGEERLLDHIALYDHLAMQSAALTHLGLHRAALEALTLLGHHVGSLLLRTEFGTVQDSAGAVEKWAGLSAGTVAGLHYTPLFLNAGSGTAGPSAGGFADLDRTALAACLRASHAQQDIQRLQAYQKALDRRDRAAYLISLHSLAQSQTVLKAALQSQLSVIETRQIGLTRAQMLEPAPVSFLNGESPVGKGPTLEDANAAAATATASTTAAPPPLPPRVWITRHLTRQKKHMESQIEKVTHSLANTQQALSLLDDPDLAASPPSRR